MMKLNSFRRLFIALMIFTSGWLHAEGGCPPGMIPASGTNLNSCVPVPPGYYNQQQAPSQAPQPIWADRFGAIATDFAHSSAGASVDRVSRDDAERAALSECSSNGGLDCKVEISYGNGCVSLAIGKTGHNAKAGPTIADANQAAMKVCNAADADCFVYYSACSLPVRIQ